MKTAYEHSVETIEFLKKNGYLIRADADTGLREAKQVMSVYGMYYRHPDHVTLGILMGSIDSWKKATSSDWSECFSR